MSANTNSGAHISFGARTSAHMSFGEHTSTYMTTQTNAHKILEHTYKIGSTYKHTHESLYVPFSALRPYLLTVKEWDYKKIILKIFTQFVSQIFNYNALRETIPVNLYTLEFHPLCF